MGCIGCSFADVTHATLFIISSNMNPTFCLQTAILVRVSLQLHKRLKPSICLAASTRLFTACQPCMMPCKSLSQVMHSKYRLPAITSQVATACSLHSSCDAWPPTKQYTLNNDVPSVGDTIKEHVKHQPSAVAKMAAKSCKITKITLHACIKPCGHDEE